MRVVTDYPVIPGEAIHLHLAAADPVDEIGIRVPLLLLPVHVEVVTPVEWCPFQSVLLATQDTDLAPFNVQN